MPAASPTRGHFPNTSAPNFNMAAISSLATDSGPALRTRDDESAQSPVTPKPMVRVRSPQPADIATFPRDNVAHDVDADPEGVPDVGSKTEATIVHGKVDDKNTASDNMGENDSADEKDDSDGDAEPGEEGSGSRKKKSQRFFCTGFPPCNLSFTRSEHLARHIRKHTGERPFQCHCNRRFSRLDNLRQHAQTVHVNEEIPVDSLAATGTRYQRQIRTDRVRPAPRPRTNTMSSSGSHSRGHSRNLSTSSITSNSSVFSNATDIRRRPPPLLMAGENRPTTPPTYSSYAAQSPAELTTPTSATFPVTPGSPNFSSVLGSPAAGTARTVAYGGTSVHGRRLSVPSSGNAYQIPYTQQYGASYGPGPAVQTPNSPQVVTSPVSSTYSSNTNVVMSPNEDWRRRTWHPSTYSTMNVNYNRPATSGLSYSQTPDAPQPAYAQNAMAAAGSAPRLPGIESFDQMQHRPSTPPRRLSPSKPLQPSLMAAPDIEGGKRGHSSHASWDGSRRSLYPEIDDNGRPATSWGRETLQQIEEQRERAIQRHPGMQSVMGPPQSINMQHSQIAQEALELQSSASKRVKRSGHYSGPQSALRTSPEDSSSSEGIPTPGTSAAEIHPTIMHSNGFIEPQLLAGDPQQTPCLAGPMPFPHSDGRYTHVQSHQEMRSFSRNASSLDRLEALVAVATGSSR